MNTKFKTLAQNSGFVLFGILIFFIGLELFLRFTPHRIEYFSKSLPGNQGFTINPGYRFSEDFAQERGFEENMFNNRGYRGPEISLEKTPGSLRILISGDSQIFGLIHIDASIPSQTAQLMEQRLGTPVEAINGGIPGSYPFEELRTYRGRGALLNPDVVILAIYVGNDIEESRPNDPCVFYKIDACYESDIAGIPTWKRRLVSFLYRFQIIRHAELPLRTRTEGHHIWKGFRQHVSARADRLFDAWEKGLLDETSLKNALADTIRFLEPPDEELNASLKRLGHSINNVRRGMIDAEAFKNQVRSLLVNQIRRIRERDPMRVIMTPVYHLQTETLYAKTSLEPTFYPEKWKNIEQAVLDFHREVTQSGKRFVLLILPSGNQVIPSLQNMVKAYYLADTGRFEYVADSPQRRLREFAQRNTMEWVDVLPYFQKHPDPASLFVPYDIHYSPEGNRLVAEALSEKLLSYPNTESQ